VFVRHVRHGGDPSLFTERCKWLGFKWVMLQAIWQKPDSRDTVINDPVETAEYAAALRDAGITPWVFGWPRPESKNIVQFVDAVERARSMAAAAGVVINPEAPWFGMRTQAVQLMHALRQAMPSSSRIGMTSYGGGPPNVPAFPWSEFASADFGVPQIYDTKHSLGPDYPQRSVRRWIAGGYPVVVPAWGASSAHTPAQMLDIASRTPLPVSACCWWDLYWILQSRGRANAVRDFVIPPPGTVMP